MHTAVVHRLKERWWVLFWTDVKRLNTGVSRQEFTTKREAEEKGRWWYGSHFIKAVEAS